MTDREGRFTLPWRSGPLDLLASAEGYQSRRQPLQSFVASPDEDLRIELEPTARVATGKVVDGLGGPIIGATVSARLGPDQPSEAAVLSGPDGDFALSFSSESAELCARAESYSFACTRARIPSDDNRLVLLPASSIVGSVVMEQGLAPVGGATVTLTSSVAPFGAPRTTTTSDDGAFSIDELPTGSYQIIAVAARARSRQQYVAVGVGETSEPLILVATPAVELTGEVLVDGSACPAGVVRLFGPISVAASVSSTGRVSLSGLLSGRYSSTAWCEGAVSAMEPLEIRDQPVEHVWRLTASPNGAAKSADPARASIVAVIDVEGELGDSLQVFAEGRARFTETARRVGERFLFDELPLGQYTVYANDRVEDAQPATLAHAGQLVTVQLNVAAGASLSGVVLDEEGSPVADAWVTQTRADTLAARFSARALTDDEGRFVFSAATNVPYALSVASPSGDSRVDEVRAGANVVIRVARVVPLTGSF